MPAKLPSRRSRLPPRMRLVGNATVAAELFLFVLSCASLSRAAPAPGVTEALAVLGVIRQESNILACPDNSVALAQNIIASCGDAVCDEDGCNIAGCCVDDVLFEDAQQVVICQDGCCLRQRVNGDSSIIVMNGGVISDLVCDPLENVTAGTATGDVCIQCAFELGGDGDPEACDGTLAVAIDLATAECVEGSVDLPQGNSVTPGFNATCVVDEDCNAPLFCSEATGRCARASCETDSDCSGRGVCSFNSCSDQDVIGTVALNEVCEAVSDCMEPYFCLDIAVCEALPCEADDVCDGRGVCIEGFCSEGTNGTRRGVVIGAVVGVLGALIVAFLAVCCCCCGGLSIFRREKKNSLNGDKGVVPAYNGENGVGGVLSRDGGDGGRIQGRSESAKKILTVSPTAETTEDEVPEPVAAVPEPMDDVPEPELPGNGPSTLAVEPEASMNPEFDPARRSHEAGMTARDDSAASGNEAVTT